MTAQAGPRGSLRQRLLAAAALWIACALGVVGVGLVLLFQHHVERELADRAQGQLDALIGALAITAPAAGPPAVALEAEPPDPAFQRPLGGLYWVVGSEGAVRLRSRSWWDHPIDPQAVVAWQTVPAGAVERFSLGGPAGQRLLLWVRRIELAGLTAPLTVAVGVDATRIRGMTQSFAFTVTTALVLLAVALWAAAWLQVRSGLAPLGQLQAALHRVREGEQATVAGRYPGEVQPLVDELNAVLANNEALLEQARHQAGNLAHALKTPLAVLGNATERWPGSEGEMVRQQLGLMHRHIDWHLVRARAAARSALAHRQGVSTALAPALEELRRVLARVHAGRQLTIEIAGEPLPAVAVEPEPLKEMLGNLLDNACRWAASRVRVTARIDPDASPRCAVVQIDDDGPGIPPERRALALQRGQRLDERPPGSGLGLAIVDELARLHGGSVELAPAEGAGLRVLLRLPLA